MQFITIKSNLFRVFVALDDYNIPFFLGSVLYFLPKTLFYFAFQSFYV